MRREPTHLRAQEALRPLVFCLALVLSLIIGAVPAQADLISGLGKIVAGVFAIPLSVITGTLSGPPILGTVLGVANGTINAVGLVAGGTLEVAASAVPIAKTVAPFLLPFLF